jgi:hypothetical protein
MGAPSDVQFGNIRWVVGPSSSFRTLRLAPGPAAETARGIPAVHHYPHNSQRALKRELRVFTHCSRPRYGQFDIKGVI